MSIPTTSPAEVLQELLVQNGYASDPAKQKAWPCYAGYMPNEPESSANLMSCYDVSGDKFGRLNATGETIEKPGVQLRLRYADYAASYAKAAAIVNYLDTVHRLQVTVRGTTYRVDNVSRLSPIMDIGTTQEEKGFKNFTVNFRLTLITA